MIIFSLYRPTEFYIKLESVRPTNTVELLVTLFIYFCLTFDSRQMWYTMEKTQNGHDLSDRLIRSICSWHSYGVYEDSEDIEELIDLGADVNRQHGTILPLHCACMVSDEESLLTLIKRGARVSLISAELG